MGPSGGQVLPGWVPEWLDAGLLAPGAAVLTFLAGALAFRLAIRPLLVWLFGADQTGAQASMRRLAGPFYILVLLLALDVGRTTLDADLRGLDRWLGGLIGAAFAVVAVQAIRVAVLDLVLESRRKVQVPGIVRDLVVGLVYLVVGLIFASTVLKIDLAPILTLSGLLSLVLGLALQETLGNLFAGLAINLEPPFSLGDWVEVEGSVGQVVEVTWRATKLRTRNDQIVVIPNNTIAKAKVINYQQLGAHAQNVRVGVAYGVSPDDVRSAIFACVAEVPEICPDPPPTVRLMSFGDSAIDYDIMFWIRDYNRNVLIADDLRSRIWYKFQQRGIEIPWPIRTVYMRDDEQLHRAELDSKYGTLMLVDFLGALDEVEKRELALAARVFRAAANENIFVQNEAGDSLFIISSGQVELYLGTREARHRLAVFSEGMFFGEMALLTGEPRTASACTLTPCELLVLTKDDLDPIFHRRPELTGEVARIIGERRAHTEAAKRTLAREIESRVAQAEADDAAADQASREIFSKIRSFFGLG